jgi:DNA polymerase II small subunit
MDQELRQIVNECISKGVLVTPEMLDDRQALLNVLRGEKQYTVRVLKNYTKPARSRSVADFVKYFNARYRQLSALLKGRKELQNVTSVARALGKRERESVALIGMVLEKRTTKNGAIVFTVEDPSGQIEAWIGADNRMLQQTASELVLDEVVGVVGSTGNKRVFVSQIIYPDIPLTKELKKGERDAHVAFVGDVEIGSKLFMRDAFEQLVLWLSGRLGSPEQREIAGKIGYVVFIGDLVHGVGVYPGQQEDSDIHDIHEQYAQFTKYVKMIPQHVQIIMIAGNHDAGRLQEPQLPIYEDFARELYAMPNVHILSNPSLVTIDETATQPGFDILLYHGYSLIYYAKEVQSIKDAGGLKAMAHVMRLYLRKRHLAPTHGCNTYVPDADEDPLVIDKVPDFLVTGHVHNVSVGMYNGVQLINPGCWNDVSEEQIKRGLEPEPARLPIVNLRTRELRVMNFYPKKEGKEQTAATVEEGLA